MPKLNICRRADAWRKCARALLFGSGLVGLTAAPAAADAEVNIENFAFAPAALTVKAGTEVVFRNRDDISHSVVGAKSEFQSKELETDDTFSFTFADPGTYDFSCGLHPQMKGKIIVTP